MELIAFHLSLAVSPKSKSLKSDTFINLFYRGFCITLDYWGKLSWTIKLMNQFFSQLRIMFIQHCFWMLKFNKIYFSKLSNGLVCLWMHANCNCRKCYRLIFWWPFTLIYNWWISEIQNKTYTVYHILLIDANL